MDTSVVRVNGECTGEARRGWSPQQNCVATPRNLEFLGQQKRFSRQVQVWSLFSCTNEIRCTLLPTKKTKNCCMLVVFSFNMGYLRTLPARDECQHICNHQLWERERGRKRQDHNGFRTQRVVSRLLRSRPHPIRSHMANQYRDHANLASWKVVCKKSTMRKPKKFNEVCQARHRTQQKFKLGWWRLQQQRGGWFVRVQTSSL